MATYVILSTVSPGAFSDPKEFKQIAKEVSERIRNECPGVTWKDSYSTMGRFDFVDIVESNDPDMVRRAAMIIRSCGRARTETLYATPWRQFFEKL